MSLASYIFGIAAAALVVIVVIEHLRRRRLRERHAIWWLVFGLLALVVAIFPGLLDWAARLLGVGAPINLAFVVSIALLFLVNLQANGELTKLEDRTRRLAERVALLEMRVPHGTDEDDDHRA